MPSSFSKGSGSLSFAWGEPASGKVPTVQSRPSSSANVEPTVPQAFSTCFSGLRRRLLRSLFGARAQAAEGESDRRSFPSVVEVISPSKDLMARGAACSAPSAALCCAACPLCALLGGRLTGARRSEHEAGLALANAARQARAPECGDARIAVARLVLSENARSAFASGPRRSVCAGRCGRGLRLRRVRLHGRRCGGGRRGSRCRRRCFATARCEGCDRTEEQPRRNGARHEGQHTRPR